MESLPQNPEFRNNLENSPMHSAYSESHNEIHLITYLQLYMEN